MRWLALVMVALVAGTVAAAPQVEVKAHSRLVLERVRLRSDNDVEVTGKLVDASSGDGLNNQLVTIHIGDQQETARTNIEGRFTVTLSAPSGPQEVKLEARGGGYVDPAPPIKLTTDPSKSQVTLTITPTDAANGINLLVAAIVDDQPEVLHNIEIAVGPANDQEPKKLRTVDSGTPFLLTRALAGGPGSKRVRAMFPGDTSRQPAVAEINLEMTSATKTTMEVAHTSLAYEDNLIVTGKVADEDVRGVARAAVTLMSGDRRLAQGATTEDGSYTFKVEAEILGQGQFGVFVQSDPGSSYMRSSHSDPQVVRIAAPQPVPVSYTIAAFLATAIAAGGFFLARSKPWQRFRRTPPPAEAPERESENEQVDGGLVVAKPGLVSTLRRPYDDGFSGVVRDTVRGRPVDGAVVRLVFGTVEREQETAPDGSFAIERLTVAEWQCEVIAPGHVTERFIVSIPHRGELRGVRVDLVPVRERVFQLYRRAAEPSLPEARLWGIWSPRQIVDHVRSKRPSPALADLTDFVEEVYFSPRVAAETVLPTASERVDRAIRERARV